MDHSGSSTCTVLLLTIAMASSASFNHNFHLNQYWFVWLNLAFLSVVKKSKKVQLVSKFAKYRITGIVGQNSYNSIEQMVKEKSFLLLPG